MSWFLGPGILIPAPYFIVNWTHTFQYFWEHTQGGQANIWSFAKDTPIFEILRATVELTFHLLGYHLLFSGVALLLCGSMFLVHRAKVDFIRIAAVCGTALVSLCIIVIGRHKNEFFLASFQWMLLLSAVFAIARLDQRQQKGSLRLLGASIAGLLLTIRMNGTLTHWRNSPESLRSASWNQKIVDLIHQHQNAHVDVSAKGGSPAVFVSIAGPVNSETLRWVGTRQGFNLDAFDSNFSADITLAKASAERATYVVLPNELSADYFRWLPSASVQPSLLEWVLSNRRFKPLSSVSHESNYFVFVNASLFEANLGEISVDGFTLLEGFLGEEGPYPKWALPRVRWMNKKSARLCVLNAPIIPHRLALRFRADKEGQFDISESDGASLASVALTPGKFTDITLTYTPKTTKNCLNFSVRIDAPANPERLLLFSRIELRGE
jgi:hypothetical protein